MEADAYSSNAQLFGVTESINGDGKYESRSENTYVFRVEMDANT